MILRVGLTGGIASGKSTIARLFGELGCAVVDADAIVARLYRPGQAGHAAIVATYGDAVLRPDGEIDRQKLSDAALGSAEGAAQLNALIHPLVLAEEERMLREELAIEGRDQIVMIEATLLLEAGGRNRYDKIVVVDVQPEVQIARGIARGLTREEVTRRMARQMPREERLAHADYRIDNSGDRAEAEAATRRVYGRLVGDLAASKRG